MIRYALAGTLALTTLLTGGVGLANGNWHEHRGDCEDSVFQNVDAASVRKLSHCVRMWEVYVDDVSAVDDSLKNGVVRAMKRLYMEGSAADQHISRYGLQRLGVPLPKDARRRVDRSSERIESPERRPGKRPTAAAPPPRERAKCHPPEPSERALKQAAKDFKKGMKAYKKKDFDTAKDYFEKMMKGAPGWETSQYNWAAVHAVTGDKDVALKTLQCLQDMGTPRATHFLKKARRDSDFRDMRDQSSQFKEITGYAKIKLLDSLPDDLGSDNVENLAASLKILHLPHTGDIEQDRVIRGHPFVFYKNHSRVTAYLIKRLLKHKETEFRLIEWETDFDIIVSWGDTIKKGGDPKVYIKDPEDAEKTIDDLGKEQDEALSKPNKAIQKVDRALDAPGRTQRKVENIIDKPGKVIDKVEKLGDKAGKLF